MLYFLIELLIGFFKSLFLFMIMHALLDFPLQGDAVAINKNPTTKTELQQKIPWWYWMFAHSLVHGGGVWLITNSVFLGCCETIAHFFIDYFKCKGVYSIHGDQMLHIACKILWTFLFVLGL